MDIVDYTMPFHTCARCRRDDLPIDGNRVLLREAAHDIVVDVQQSIADVCTVERACQRD